jgi:hypothetical protein
VEAAKVARPVAVVMQGREAQSFARLKHLNNFVQFVRQLTGQHPAERVTKAAVVPKGSLFGLAKAGPNLLPDFGFSQVSKNGTSVVNFVSQGYAENVLVSRS